MTLIHRENKGASKVDVKSIGYLKNHTVTDLVVIILFRRKTNIDIENIWTLQYKTISAGFFL